MNRISSCLSVLCSFCITVAAQEPVVSMPEKADTVRLLKESVIVAAPALPKYRETIPAQTLTGDELERLNSLSVADAVRYFSGVQLKDYGGVAGLKTVNVRSLGAAHTAVFYDGLQIGNAQNGQVDLGRFSLDEIGEISLYNGQKSDIFQPAKDFGASSSIYLQSARPVFSEGRKVNVKATLKTGSFGLLNPSASVAFRLSDNISLTVSSGLTNASGRYRFRCRGYDQLGRLSYDTTAVRHNGDIFSVRSEAALYGRTKTGNWSVRAYNYHSDRGVPGAIVSNVFRNGERMRDDNFFVQGRAVNVWSRKFRSMFNARYAHDYTFYEDKDSRSLHVSNTYRQNELYFSSANMWQAFSRMDVSLSYDFQWNSLDVANYMFGNAVFPRPYRLTNMVSLAASFDLGRLKMQGSAFGQFVSDKSREFDNVNDRRSELSPAFYASYKLLRSKELYIRAFSKRSFRMPTFNDLYYTNSANALLKPESTVQTDLGTEYSDRFSFCTVHLSADAYWNMVKDKIIAYPNGQQFRWTMLNLGKVDIRGVDVAADVAVDISKVRLAARLQYSFQKAIDITDKTTFYYKNQIPYAPEHSGSAVLSAEYSGWSLNYSFLYTGGRYSHKENTRKNYLQPWYTSDLSLQKKMKLKANVLKITAEVNNVFNQDYEVVLNYPMPGINFRLTVSYELF